MDAFFVFAPRVLNQSQYLNIDIGLLHEISIAGLYPIHSSEMEIINKQGLEFFWKHPKLDLYNVNRKPVTT